MNLQRCLQLFITALVSWTMINESTSEPVGKFRKNSEPIDAEADTEYILHFSDVHLNLSSYSPSKYGSYGMDSSVDLFESALEYATTLFQETTPKFLLYTGDHTVHGRLTKMQIRDSVRKNVQLMQQYFPESSSLPKENSSSMPARIISPTFGQLTSILGNADFNPSKGVNSYIEYLSPTWKNSLLPTEMDSFSRGGYFLHEIDASFFMISINTVQYSPIHTPKSNDSDPFNQFEWLRNTLHEIHQKNGKVYIVGHIPPIIGIFGESLQWEEHFIQTYQQTTISKAHSSLPCSTPENTSALRSPLFMSGAISPLFGNNPTFSIWKYDKKSRELLDMEVHYMSFTKENTENAVWKKMMSIRDEFHLPALSASAFRDLTKRMASDTALFEKYSQSRNGNSSLKVNCSSIDCKAKHLCGQEWIATMPKYDECLSRYRSQLASTGSATNSTKHKHSVASHLWLYLACAVLGCLLLFLLVAKITSYFRRRDYQPLERQRKEPAKRVGAVVDDSMA